MRITEIFDSVQGEGPAMGLPCTFVRFAGCNLRCHWCDTPQSSWNPVGEDISLESLLERLGRNPGRTVVITGGEPFLHAGLSELCRALRRQGHPIHLETAGTVFQEIDADLVCISPKLEGSAPSAIEYPEWHARHESIRQNLAPLQALLARWPKDCYLKFVVESEQSLAQIQSFLTQIHFTDKNRVFLMPQCRNVAELEALGPKVAEWCVREGFRYSDRLHVRLWPSETGR